MQETIETAGAENRKSKAVKANKATVATVKETKGAAAKKRKPAQKSKQKCAFMYVGPNIPGGRLFTSSLYRDCLPKHFDADFKKLPELKKLFVDVKDLAKFKKDLAAQGTEAYRLYHHVEARIREGALKDGV